MPKMKSKKSLIPGEVNSMKEAVAALEQMEEIQAEIEEKQRQTVELKQSVTSWAVDHKVETIQLDDHYYRQIQRYNRGWDADALKELVKGKKDGNGKPLWNFITKRVPDAEKINTAVKMKFLKQTQVDKAFVETPQKPFLQKFQGESYGS